MDVHDIGTEVVLAGEIPAIITSISVRGQEHRVTYECTWWDQRTRKVDWFDPVEIEVKRPKPHSLSFVSPKT